MQFTVTSAKQRGTPAQSVFGAADVNITHGGGDEVIQFTAAAVQPQIRSIILLFYFAFDCRDLDESPRPTSSGGLF